LRTINTWKAMPVLDRLAHRLERRARSYLAVRGAMDEGLAEKVDRARRSIESSSADAPSVVESAIGALKQGFM